MTSKKVCVDLGSSSRIVHFNSASSDSDLEEVCKAVRRTFGLEQNVKLIIQAQSDPDWSNKWLDVFDGEEIPDKSELRAIISQVWLLLICHIK